MDDALESVIKKGSLEFQSTIPKRNLNTSRIYFITVGTPLIDGKISTSAFQSALFSIFSEVCDSDCIVTRSTVAIGMTRKLVSEPLISMGISADVVVAPERTVEGVALSELATLPQIIGGDMVSVRRIQELFEDIGVETSILKNLESAEFAKLMSNSFRDLLFGISNEYAMLADHLGIDFKDILESSKRGYIRLSALTKPGPVAGPCLSKDPKIFSQSAAAAGFQLKITESSRQQNEYLAKHVVETILKTFKHGKIGILGLAFKGIPDTNDTRDSFVNLILKEIVSTVQITEILLWDPLDSKIYEDYLYGAKYAKLSEIINDCDLIVLQNASPYFSSSTFIEQLSKRDRPDKLIVYQLCDSLPAISNHVFDVKSLGSFGTLVEKEK